MNGIHLAGLRRSYGERPVLRGVDMDLEAGETLLVVGPNGAGKTTLLRILATLLRPGGGEVAVLGCELPREAWKLRGRIGYLAHDPLLYLDLTGRENLDFHAKLHGLADAESRVGEVLAALGMSRRADDRVSDFSAGMRQRLAICRACLHQPDLLLLDEPDSNLDQAGREQSAALTGPAPGLTRVIVSHDPDRYRSEADQVLDLTRGTTQTAPPRGRSDSLLDQDAAASA